MTIYFLKYETGNGYNCGCCRVTTEHSETIDADSTADLIKQIQGEIRYDPDDGCTITGLVSGITGVDYTDDNDVYNLFNKLIVSMCNGSREKNKVAEKELEIRRAVAKFNSDVASYDKQLKDGLITEAGRDHWCKPLVNAHQRTLDSLNKQLESLRKESTRSSREEIVADLVIAIDAVTEQYVKDAEE